MLTIVLAMLAGIASSAVTDIEVQISPAHLEGPLAGSIIEAPRGGPAVLMLPGSGPIDRNGIFASGHGAGHLRALALELAEDGVTTLRIDKRGSFGSRAAAPDAERVSLRAKAEDALAWSEMLRRRTDKKCIWILGHSEGGIVALLAAQQSRGICGLVLLASPGRRMTDWARAHMRANPAFAPYLEQAENALRTVDGGGNVDPAALPLPWQSATEGEAVYWTDMARQDPTKLASKIKLPILILQGTADRIVTVEDAETLAAAAPNVRLKLLPGLNHLLMDSDPSKGVHPAVAQEIASFVRIRS